MKTENKWGKLARRTATLAIVACVGFALTGCGDDDGDGEGTTSSIIGTWECIEMVTPEGTTTLPSGEYFWTLTFTDDGTMTWEENLEGGEYFKESSSYSLKGNELHFDNGEYWPVSISGGTIVVEGPSYKFTFQKK
ncbi:hypothetical protein PDESU_04136 [Pontiella desulfatans]|uniref:Lipocalin-like domain-containing protein n=1 Tax=Pontiella desulfatans TaxID=2750659 RepID=A0A6C2U7Q5_PONDE|nr:lipocalin family protein [Pontiella desulfatans]VGO15551.1 hypothetical protein PDESU_04136 [Pontiella desulfatans]